ncbi:MAG TPA: hypothetical protein VMT17_13630 [Anaeromyxobacteraceae bacterium]|nr:hypothetical protein [Anaeromyxobacteraceae bacterium]
MKRSIRTWFVVAAAALPIAAQAQTGAQGKGLGDFSVVGSEINTGKPVETIEAGWPSVDFGYVFNLSPSSDMGVKLGLLYGVEGSTYTTFGLALYAPIRFELTRVGDGKLLFHVDPGITMYFGSSVCSGLTGNALVICNDLNAAVNNSLGTGFQFGFTFPVGLVMGFPVAPGLEVGGGFDLNLALVVTSPFNFVIGPWIGPYVEYHFTNPNIAIGLNTRFGAAINTASAYTNPFAFKVQAFAGYRLF